MGEQEEAALSKFEEITGVSRNEVFSWDGIIVKEQPCPKWLERYVEFINLGAKYIGKRPFKFNSGQYQNIGRSVKEVAEDRKITKEEAITLLIKAVSWKAKIAKGNKKETQFYTKDYFSRKKNNLKLNLWHYENWANDRPFTSKDFTKLLQSEEVAEKRKKTTVRGIKSKSLGNTAEVLDPLNMFS